MTKVSIIIPCRNEERHIGKCLDSIIANDYPKDKLQVLIIDGNSADQRKVRIVLSDAFKLRDLYQKDVRAFWGSF